MFEEAVVNVGHKTLDQHLQRREGGAHGVMAGKGGKGGWDLNDANDDWTMWDV